MQKRFVLVVETDPVARRHVVHQGLLRVPCLTLRETTEHRVTVTQGTNRVIGTDPRRIAPEVLPILDDRPGPTTPPPLWNGRAARRIVEILLSRDIAIDDPSGRGEDAKHRGAMP